MPHRRNRADYAGSHYATQQTPIHASNETKKQLKKYMSDPANKKKMRKKQKKALAYRHANNA